MGLLGPMPGVCPGLREGEGLARAGGSQKVRGCPEGEMSHRKEGVLLLLLLVVVVVGQISSCMGETCAIIHSFIRMRDECTHTPEQQAFIHETLSQHTSLPG